MATTSTEVKITDVVEQKNGDLIKEQEDLLQCPICIDRLEDPKDLLCNHTFCKGCLDDLLEFQNDGSALIQCPMKCSPVNYIDPTMTTNDLKTSYHLKSMLDWFEAKENKESSNSADASCQGEEECSNTITTYCTTCSLMMCQSCQIKHTLTQNQPNSPTPPPSSYVPIRYDKKYEATVPICKAHNTVATLICCEKEFICIYCRQRRHQGHLNEHIDVIADQIQTEIITMEKNVKSRTEQIQKGVGNALQATETQINHGREALKKVLNQQKLSCLAEYHSLLKSEEERLLTEYDEVTSSHIELYKWNHSRDHFLNLQEKLPFQFIHEEEKLFEHMLERSFGVEVPLLTIGKRDAVYDACNPLGNITLNVTGNVVINHESVDMSSVTVNITNDPLEHVSPEFLEEVKQLVAEQDESHPSSNGTISEERGGVSTPERELTETRQQYEPFDRGIKETNISSPSHRAHPTRSLLNRIKGLTSSDTNLTKDDAPVTVVPVSESITTQPIVDEIPTFRRGSPQLLSVELIKTTYQDFGLYLSGEGKTKQGVVVCDIDKGSPADKKLKIGDKIMTINGVILNGDVEHDILQQINSAGNKILLGIRRSGTSFVSFT